MPNSGFHESGWHVRNWPIWSQFAISLCIVGLALIARGFMTAHLQDRLPFFTLFLVLLPLVMMVRPLPFLVAAIVGYAGVVFLVEPPAQQAERSAFVLYQTVLFIVGVSAAAFAAHLSGRARARAAAEYNAILRVNEVAALCVRTDVGIQQALNAILAAAVEITGAEMGNIQLADRPDGRLRIAAWQEFGPRFLHHFAVVDPRGSTACARAFSGGGRIFAQDIRHTPDFADPASLGVLLNAGVLAVLSTPLRTSAGNILGVISTHYRRPTRMSAREPAWMDLLARQAADSLERRGGLPPVRTPNGAAAPAAEPPDLAPTSIESKTPTDVPPPAAGRRTAVD